MSATYSYNMQYWPYAVLMIIFASWFLYQFVVPRSWRDWRGAGLIQAFIIALYAEMYGFPLTIYLLTGFLHVDVPILHDSGHLWAALLGYGATGAAIEMLLGMAFVVTGILLIIKGWVRIYFSRATDEVVTDGIYGVIRHPQYTGIYAIVVGELIHWPTVLTLSLAPIIVCAYVRLARKEEARMIERFGDEYRAYQQHVPMFLPRWRPRSSLSRGGGD